VVPTAATVFFADRIQRLLFHAWGTPGESIVPHALAFFSMVVTIPFTIGWTTLAASWLGLRASATRD
jgi:hypothetical protein